LPWLSLSVKLFEIFADLMHRLQERFLNACFLNQIFERNHWFSIMKMRLISGWESFFDRVKMRESYMYLVLYEIYAGAL